MGKKRLLLLLTLLLFVCSALRAQEKTVTGKVTGEDGNPIFGATIAVKGTTIGTISGENGAYTIKVPERVANDSLVFSYLGYQDQVQPMAGRTTINVVMQEADLQVEEVVVTALGISREKKALGYAVTDVDGDELSKSRGGLNNPVNALQGKVAGLQITSGAGSMGGSSKVIIRGNNSLSGSNQPLFVVDGVPIEGKDYNSIDTQRGAGGYDYGNLIQDINPDDIENISVLKGASATALYGSRASNGVVMITTKKAKKGSGFNVDFTSTIGFEVVTKLPKLQNQYGGGYGYMALDGEDDFGEAEINGVKYTTVDYEMDESWGPKLDGRQVLSWYDLAKWEANGKQGNPTTSPWSPSSSDIRDFFKLGVSQQTNIAISQSTDNGAFRISYTNSTLDGYVPNSSMYKNTINVSGNISSLDKKFDVFTNVSYFNSRAKGRQEIGYGDNNYMVKFTQWGQRQLNMNELEDLYIFPDGTMATWNRNSYDDPSSAYHNNIYWSRFKNYENDERNRVYGNLGTSYKIFPFLKAQYKVNLDFFVDKQYERNAVGSNEQSKYKETTRQKYEINHEFL
ncbi:MAG: TonB-dependent receptor plug domain-containing protein, partial [Bacteroidales bacterium]|nr:TonB-dependent receptor plug domain-containing protein [Bacteroidales bacterium]